MIPKRAQPYWQFVLDAARRYGFEGHVYEFGGIIDRESLFGVALAPPGPQGVGDYGHGRGLCQIDDRAHSTWVDRTDVDGVPTWKNPEANIYMGASLFASYLLQMVDYGEARLIAAIAAYNAGPTRVRRALDDLTQPASYEAQLQALDAICTTGAAGPYVTDVLNRAARLMAVEDPTS